MTVKSPFLFFNFHCGQNMGGGVLIVNCEACSNTETHPNPAHQFLCINLHKNREQTDGIFHDDSTKFQIKESRNPSVFQKTLKLKFQPCTQSCRHIEDKYVLHTRQKQTEMTCQRHAHWHARWNLNPTQQLTQSSNLIVSIPIILSHRN